MNTSAEHILQCNQSEPLADASGRIVDLMNENADRPEEDISQTNTGRYDNVNLMLDQRCN